MFMPNKLLIKDFHPNNKPRERLITKGPEALSDSELLAIVLNTGGKNLTVLDLANQLINKFGSLKNVMESNLNRLTAEKHLGIAKATTIKTISEISKRVYLTQDTTLKTINNPLTAYQAIKSCIFGKKQEHLYLLSLDSRKKLIAKDLICIGSINETIVPIREIYKKALERNSVYIILIHNHPSNDPNPSIEDIKVTEKIIEAGNTLGVICIDHIVATDNAYISIKGLNNSITKV